MPHPTALAFYSVNVFIVVGYIIACAFVVRRAHRFPMVTRAAAITFFICCFGVHAELAAHIYTGASLIDPVTRAVSWHFLTIVTIKVAALYVFLLASVASPARPPLAPPKDPCEDAIAEAVAMEAVAAYRRQAREAAAAKAAGRP